MPIDLHGVDRLLAACARNDAQNARSIGNRDSELARRIVARGGKLLGEFAGVGNTEGVRHLLDLGVDVSALDKDSDGYWGVANNGVALHVSQPGARNTAQ